MREDRYREERDDRFQRLSFRDTEVVNVFKLVAPKEATIDGSLFKNHTMPLYQQHNIYK